MSDEFEIRRAVTVAEYQACQEAQRKAWGITDDTYIVPLATLVGANLHGGLVLGAFTPYGDALGLSFAFLGKVEGRPCLYSQLTGIVPGSQGAGLGYQLKQAQRDFARDEGIPRLAWAFDPLQAGNARFNLDKLGAWAGKYVVDMYGKRSDALNAGAASDRLIVEWEAEPTPPRPVPEIQGLPRLIEVRGGNPGALPTGLDSTTLLEIPVEITRLRQDRPELAEAWSEAVRRAFLGAFEAGYRATGFVRDASGSFYVLTRGD